MMVHVASREDLPAVLALEECFEHARWSEASWAEEIDSDRGYVLVERNCGGDVLGAATFSHAGDVVDLNRVVVAPDHRRHGVGRRLLLAGLEWAGEVGASQMMLEVDADNEPAKALYHALGFRTLAQRPHYYGPGRHALVMACPLEEDDD